MAEEEVKAGGGGRDEGKGREEGKERGGKEGRERKEEGRDHPQ